jgi:hypothetical protein
MPLKFPFIKRKLKREVIVFFSGRITSGVFPTLRQFHDMVSDEQICYTLFLSHRSITMFSSKTCQGVQNCGLDWVSIYSWSTGSHFISFATESALGIQTHA